MEASDVFTTIADAYGAAQTGLKRNSRLLSVCVFIKYK